MVPDQHTITRSCVLVHLFHHFTGPQLQDNHMLKAQLLQQAYCNSSNSSGCLAPAKHMQLPAQLLSVLLKAAATYRVSAHQQHPLSAGHHPQWV
jgi:hypothetical protein